MTIDATIDQYRQTKEAMAKIIDRHMIEAFAEIRQKFGVAPNDVSIHVMDEFNIGDRHPEKCYAGCVVSMGEE